MTGGVDFHVANSKAMLDTVADKEMIQHCVWTLLSHQYIENEQFPERIWQVVTGSGMGLAHSGE
eukprot:7557286-Karenia_brevis.AAC.1